MLQNVYADLIVLLTEPGAPAVKFIQVPFLQFAHHLDLTVHFIMSEVKGW